ACCALRAGTALGTLVGRALCDAGSGARGQRRRPAMSNPVFEAVSTSLAVREYQDREISDDVVDRIVEAGHLAASSINKQPWHFVVVRDRQGLEALGGLVKTGPYIPGPPARVG